MCRWPMRSNRARACGWPGEDDDHPDGDHRLSRPEDIDKLLELVQGADGEPRLHRLLTMFANLCSADIPCKPRASHDALSIVNGSRHGTGVIISAAAVLREQTCA